MNQPDFLKSQWKSSSSMIFGGILALTIFGLVASGLDSIYSVTDAIKRVFEQTSQFTDFASLSQETANRYGAFFAFNSRLGTFFTTCQLIAIIGWIFYVVGLSQFRKCQTSDRGIALSGSVYNACWLGLISMACTFIGSFIGWFGLLFSFAGWILMLISVFKFKGAFNRLAIEQSWNETARRGAANLRTSYTFAIILMFYPIISGVVIGLGYIGSIGGAISSFGSSDMLGLISAYAASGILIVVLLGLVALTLWICKVIYLLLGWNRVNAGSLMIEEESAEGEEADSDYEHGSNNRGLIIAGALIGAIFLFIGAAYYCVQPFYTDAQYSFHPIESVDEEEQDNQVESAFGLARSIISSTAERSDAEEYEAVEREENPYTEPTGDNYTYTYRGTINDKYKIEMTLSSDGGDYYTGEYFYIKNKTPIQLRGQLSDDGGMLMLDEYVGMNNTGSFSGVLSGDRYEGKWVSADGDTTYPFTVVKIK